MLTIPRAAEQLAEALDRNKMDITAIQGRAEKKENVKIVLLR